ncbi:MAG: TIGR00701 family protein, partial [Mesorhizobium sp.]
MAHSNNNENSTGQAMMRMTIGIVVLVVLTAVLYFAAPDSFYPWAKAIHILAVISWMAGMLYLPRLLVYHTDAEKDSVQSETFKVMERRLLRGIINPAMIVTWVFGLWLAWKGFGFQGGWLPAKIGAVLLL